jgi:hypothetical protein
VHQAYIQFLAVCNYEKIKPLYLKELSETIRKGDYTYAFNSYLLPDHWEEAADTLIKYYWDVKDEDTKEKMNKAIVKIKMEKEYPFYLEIVRKGNYEIISSLITSLFIYEPKIENEFILLKLIPQIGDKNVRERYLNQIQEYREELYKNQ